MRTTIQSSDGERRRPKEVTGRMVLICLIAFFGIVASVNAIMIRAAISTFGGLETESSYKAGQAFARETAASEAQDARHWTVTAHLSPIVDGEIRIDLNARDGAQRPLAGFDVTARLAHPTDRRLDRTVVLTPSGAGRFAGRAAEIPGQRDLVIEFRRDGERMFLSKERVTLAVAP